ncbi:hypothetical protein IFM89_002834 [Coptis chinensis]|uniref:Uncharacterized protein n=1 Tax=Coptis chinensis TaxID=261450 RepID=A0A835HZS0_9MAGN|nr:hypothetical protein IFM89_002834 [Coptis chinensis]
MDKKGVVTLSRTGSVSTIARIYNVMITLVTLFSLVVQWTVALPTRKGLPLSALPAVPDRDGRLYVRFGGPSDAEEGTKARDATGQYNTGSADEARKA